MFGEVKMTQKIAIAVIHGIGQADADFADPRSPRFVSGLARKLRPQFARLIQGQVARPELELEIEPVYWAPIVQDLQDELWERLQIKQNHSSFFGLRGFIFHSLADSVAYQTTSSTSSQDRYIYDAIHHRFAETLGTLAERAGDRAPLCIIAHSLGSAIASNYVWDLQSRRAPVNARNNPLEQGETLSLFYTFGSQIAFWSLRHKNFGTPIQVPSPDLMVHYPHLGGEWLNFFSRNDVLGYPLNRINAQYQQVVQDREVRVGNLLTFWNPLSHNAYWRGDRVISPIAQSLATIWRQANGLTPDPSRVRI